MDNYKIKVKDEAESKEAQELFVQLGYELFKSKRIGIVATEDNGTVYPDVIGNWDAYEGEELTISQLRDLVAQSKSKVREYLVEDVETGKYFLTENNSSFVGAIEVPEGAEFYMEMRVGLKVGCKFFFKFDDEDLRVLSGSGWQHASYDSIQEYVDEGDQLLWSRETVKKDPALISGDVALDALKAKKEVEYCGEGLNDSWLSAETLPVVYFLTDSFKFRVKPTTLTVNAELPKPHKETQQNTEVYAVTYEFKTREERNAFADKLRGTNS